MELTAATETDVEHAKELLREHRLPTDVDRSGVEIFVGRVGGRTVGVCGLEVHGPYALVRSVAVEPDERETGYGTALVSGVLDHARERGIEGCYLLTEDAEDFFETLGFERIERETVPEAIRETSEFADVCPASATALYREVDGNGR